MWPQQHEVEVTLTLAAAAAMVVGPGLTSSLTHGRCKRAHMAKGVTIRLSLTSLLGVDVVRPLAVASLDCEKHHKKNDNDEVEDGGYDDDDCLSSIEEKKKKGQKEKRLVCPAFTLPAADHAAALTLLQQRAARDAATRAEAILAAKKSCGRRAPRGSAAGAFVSGPESVRIAQPQRSPAPSQTSGRQVLACFVIGS